MGIHQDKASFLLCICLAALATVPADGHAADYSIDRSAVITIARDITPERYPNADDVVVDEYVSVVYEADGTSVMIDDEYVKVLTEKGRRSHQSLSYHFTLPYGTVAVTQLEIIKPDGTVTPIDVEGQSRVMVNRSQMNSNIYNPNSKTLSVGVPGLEIGDMCHITVREETVKPRVPDTWSDYSVFEYTTPMKHVVYEVNGPASLPLLNIALKSEIEDTVAHTRREDGERITYRWEVTNVPRTYAEPNMPAMYTVTQRLLVSTIPDWQHISRWYWGLCLPHLETVNDDMRAKVQELTTGIDERRERINRIFQFVSQQIRYMGITTEAEAPGYEPHDVSITFNNRYGVCRDKAALLVAMLRLADVPAYPVIIQVGPKKDTEVPQPYFNHAIVAAEDEAGAYILMDPTDENTAEFLPAYLCHRSYLVAHPEGKGLLTSPIIPAESNMLHIATEGALDGSGTLSAETTLRFDGINDNAYRGHFSRLKPEERKRFFEGALKHRIAGATLKECRILPEDIQDTSQALEVHLTFQADDFLIKGADHAVFTPPWLSTTLGYANFVLGRTGLDKRKYPLETEIACGVSETFTIDAREAFSNPISTPGYETIDTGGVFFSANIGVEGGRMSGGSEFKIQNVEFSPDEYLVLKQALKDAEYERRKVPLLRLDGDDQEQDVLVLSAERVIELTDATQWKDTQRVKKKILTYAGKKENSELKIAFNPAWETVSLTTAVVTTATGEIRSVVDEEMNIMDAAWVGSAPRYPPERTMVVSLPGVDIGSTIEYEIVREKRERPFFSTVASFASHDPVLTNRLEIAVPASLRLRIQDNTGDVVIRENEIVEERRRHVWTAVSQPVIPKEDALPPWWSFTPTVMISSGAWESYAQQVFSALTNACTVSESVRDATRDVIAGLKGEADQITAIRDYVARNIRRAGPSLDGLPLSEITPATRTLQDGYGNSADCAVLLNTMLAAAGIEAEMILASSHAPTAAALHSLLHNTPQRELYDGVLVEVKTGDRTVYLGDTDQYAQLGATAHHEQPGLSKEGWQRIIHAADECTPITRNVIDITVDEQGTAVIFETTEFRAMDYSAFHRRFAELPPEERRRHYLELLGGLSQAAVAETDLMTDYGTYPGRQSYTARVERYAVRSGNYLHLTLPGQIPALANLRAATRTQPLYRASHLHSETIYHVFLPTSTAAIEIAPEDLEWRAPRGLGHVTISTKVNDTPVEGEPNVVITQLLRINPCVIPAADYPALLDMNRKLQHQAQRTLLVRLRETAGQI